jgi:hypothetical protein
MVSTIRKLGTADDHECARWIASECYHQVSLLICDFARSLGGWDNLPNKFVISDGEPGGWHGDEAGINKAVLCGDWLTTWVLCTAYKARVEKYLDHWRGLTKAPATRAAQVELARQ